MANDCCGSRLHGEYEELLEDASLLLEGSAGKIECVLLINDKAIPRSQERYEDKARVRGGLGIRAYDKLLNKKVKLGEV
jgi:hypothetical protein